MRAKPAVQTRSQAKRDAILIAMNKLLLSAAFEDITVAMLADKAKVSPATIYQRFSNKDATGSVLLELYYSKVEEHARSESSESIGGLPLFEALLSLSVDASRMINRLGHIMRPAYLYSRRYPERVGEDWSRLQATAEAGFEAFIKSHTHEIATDNHLHAAKYLCYFFNFMTIGFLLHKDDDSSLAEIRSEMTESIACMAYQYLVNPPPPLR